MGTGYEDILCEWSSKNNLIREESQSSYGQDDLFCQHQSASFSHDPCPCSGAYGKKMAKVAEMKVMHGHKNMDFIAPSANGKYQQ